MSMPALEMQQAVFALARAVDLVDIRTVGFSAKTLEPAREGQQLAVAVEPEVKTAQLPDGFVVEARFTLKARAGSEAGHEFLEMFYHVGAVYRLASALPPVEVLGAFAETNGMIHLWPYFRAYVQQTCAQLGLPPIILPPFRISPGMSTGQVSDSQARN
ncbi:MAG TPA: hypothetical protein VEU33_03405 [Archangium sp.]|nr:hypothetical protein [Archangium sp.]